VWPLGVVVSPPGFDDDLGLGEAVEDLTVEQFVAELRVEALAVAVLPRASRFDERCLCADGYDPLPYSLGDELRAVAPTEGISRDGCNSGARSLSLQARTARGAMASQIFSRM